MSLRDLADLTNVSNPYLSQIERGLHEPSVRVLKAIAVALERLDRDAAGPGRPGHRRRAGRRPSDRRPPPTPTPPSWPTPPSTDDQRSRPPAVYRSYVDRLTADSPLPTLGAGGAPAKPRQMRRSRVERAASGAEPTQCRSHACNCKQRVDVSCSAWYS